MTSVSLFFFPLPLILKVPDKSFHRRIVEVMMKNRLFLVLCTWILLGAGMVRGLLPGRSRTANPSDRMNISTRLPRRSQYPVRFISSGSARSVEVGREILQRGGSAVDAAIASALLRIAENMGLIVSYAGIFSLVHYSAASGEVHSLNACFKTPAQPFQALNVPGSGYPNARAVLVPGFMAGVQTAHNRFGRLPFAELFAPAIELAENGFPLHQVWIDYIRDHWNMLGVLPETRNIFLKRSHGLFRGYQAGDLFTQPELAHTLRQVALQGAAYMYHGAWGRKFVDIIRREGGYISYSDMENYDPVWAAPAHTTYNNFDIYALGSPSLGAAMVVLGINLMECAGLANLPHCSVSAEALYRLIYCSRIGELFYPPYTGTILDTLIPGGNFGPDGRIKKENAGLIWAKVLSGDWPQIEYQIARDGYHRPHHSEAIIATDSEGNIAVICHTINVDNWGNTGIFVDGVSIPGPVSEQQQRVDMIGPNAYLPDTMNPLLVLKNGRPFLASSCIGSEMHSITVQHLYNILNFSMSPAQSEQTPMFQSLDIQRLSQRIRQGVFPQSLIDTVQSRGIRFVFVDYEASAFWIGVRYDR